MTTYFAIIHEDRDSAVGVVFPDLPGCFSAGDTLDEAVANAHAALRLYAEAGIPEYWVVDCTAETVEVYRGPGPQGYGEVIRVSGTATLAPQAFPDVELTTTEIFA